MSRTRFKLVSGAPNPTYKAASTSVQTCAWYALDQLFHLLSILLVTLWVSNEADARPFLPPAFWIIPAIGDVWATYVRYITERVIS